MVPSYSEILMHRPVPDRLNFGILGVIVPQPSGYKPSLTNPLQFTAIFFLNPKNDLTRSTLVIEIKNRINFSVNPAIIFDIIFMEDYLSHSPSKNTSIKDKYESVLGFVIQTYRTLLQ